MTQSAKSLQWLPLWEKCHFPAFKPLKVIARKAFVLQTTSISIDLCLLWVWDVKYLSCCWPNKVLWGPKFGLQGIDQSMGCCTKKVEEPQARASPTSSLFSNPESWRRSCGGEQAGGGGLPICYLRLLPRFMDVLVLLPTPKTERPQFGRQMNYQVTIASRNMKVQCVPFVFTHCSYSHDFPVGRVPWFRLFCYANHFVKFCSCWKAGLHINVIIIPWVNKILEKGRHCFD